MNPFQPSNLQSLPSLPPTTKITIDKSILQSILNSGKIFHEEFIDQDNNKNYISIKQLEDEYGTFNLATYLTSSTFFYGGFNSISLTAEDFSFCKYPNGDIYIGDFKNNKREGFGVYFFNEEKNFYKYNSITKSINSLNYKQVYLGSWEKDVMEGEGIFIWVIKEDIPKEKSEVKIFEGEVKNGQLTKGLYMLLKNEKLTFVWGDPSKEGESENIYYYHTSLFGDKYDRIYLGKTKEGVFTKGNVVIFNTEKQEFYKMEQFMLDTDNGKHFIDNENNDEMKHKDDLIKKCKNFMKICLESDSMGDLFDAYKKDLIPLKENFEQEIGKIIPEKGKDAFSLPIEKILMEAKDLVDDIYSKLNYYKSFITASRRKNI